LSEIIKLPFRSVVSAGLKVTDTLQLLPGASVFWHSDFTENTDGDAPSISIVTAVPVFLLPLFLIVTDFELLVFPTVVLAPKSREEGLIVITPGGVGEGVGVCVAVEVAVAVAPVAVAVGVALRVAVGVAVLDPLEEAVGVAL
jgi:hypothetical protein